MTTRITAQMSTIYPPHCTFQSPNHESMKKQVFWNVMHLHWVQQLTTVSGDHSAFILMIGSQEESSPIYTMTKHLIPHNLHLWQHSCEKLKP